MKFTKAFFNFFIVVGFIFGLLFFQIEVQGIPNKKAFLTFDDGPSPNVTLKIMEALNKKDIKATFFVVGNKVEEYPEILDKLVENGMCIGVHTYSHEYSDIYSNVDAYIRDLKKCEKVIIKHVQSPIMKYIRIPGGSITGYCDKYVMKKIRKAIVENNYKYVDWNVVSGDSVGRNISTYKIKDNIIKQCKDKDYVVILMHDSYYKETTAKVLPEIIDYLENEGYTFHKLDELTEEDEKILIKEQVINKKLNSN